ncbi:uncharacterized protein CTRU02_204353 [Colletotrichum truncatum]|uniref:Uncharacterized protein n=1 Tax=Colletotrichum truncatum TaxID=5467 RepID=A0ACC3ZBT9_COLTU|nr:uncharacterized protein CTRU02_13074 [Colletotrichum truncatum]KAF6783824.1 hypothetical protein CTRU02_13074 [Colletotrichum truncatum]
MTLSAFTITLVAALSGAATAVVCTPSQTYCGSHLLKVDANNQKDIEKALAAGKQPVDDAHVTGSVFWCVPPGVPAGQSGLLLVTYCGPNISGPIVICKEGGALGGVGDACAAVSNSFNSAKFRQ